jgi:hypothetical protein
MADELSTMFAPAYRKGETLPIQMSLADLYSMARVAQTGREHGMPAWGQNQLLDKMLVEGRADAGFNAYDTNNKKADLLANTVKNKLKDSSLYLNQRVLGYPAAVLEKDMVAQQLGIPIERAWNGTGRSVYTGRTGAQHAQRAAQMAGTQDDPRNAAINDFLKRAAKDELTPKERLGVMAGNHQLYEMFSEQDNEKPLRKYMRDNKVTFDEGTQALLSDPNVLKTAYLRDQGVAYPKTPYEWERPTMGNATKGSPTYKERSDAANRALELKMLERNPEAKAYLQDRLYSPPRDSTVMDKFHDWLDTRKNTFK